MSETWVIKDTAPVDEASRVLPKINVSFTTANGLEFGKALEVVTEGSICSLLYYLLQSGTKFTITAADMDFSAETAFVFGEETRKTLVFDTAPTGELLAWLQKNADKQAQDKAYLAKESELKDIADAIRSVGGTTEQLVFPDGFAAAIGTLYIITMSQSEYAAASAAGTLDGSKWYGVYPDA